MPKFTLSFTMENDTLRNHICNLDAAAEISIILRNAAARVEFGYTEGLISDTNGNSIGSFKITQTRKSRKESSNARRS